MNLPTSEPLPPEEHNLPPARRRRRKRLVLPEAEGERAEFLASLAYQATPSVEFFVLSLLCGLIIGAACLTNLPALFVLAALLSPFLGPVAGLSLASVFGSRRFFVQMLGSIAISTALVFLGSGLAGLGYTLFPGIKIQQALYHAHLSLIDFIVLSGGAISAVFLLVKHPSQRPVISSIALSYELFLPLGVAGFGLTSGINGLFPDGLIVFIVHLAWAALIGTATFFLLGLRPTTVFGYTLSSTLLLISLIALIAISGIGTAMSTELAMPTHPPTMTLSPSLSATLSNTPKPPTTTPTPTNTLVPTRTPTQTLSPQPTPVWGKINAYEGDGAFIRSEPRNDAQAVKILSNGSIVEILPEVEKNSSGIWVHVRAPDGETGWIRRILLITATAAPPS